MSKKVTFNKYIYWRWSKNRTPMCKTSRTMERNVRSEAKAEIAHFIDDKGENKRSICNERISQRYHIIQTKVNPYLTTNYIEDLSVQDNFLRPRDSNF